jgi:hypothetical protein
MKAKLFAIGLAVAGASFAIVRGADAPAAKHPTKADEMQCCAMDPKASATLERIKKLEGTWTIPASENMPAMNITFKPTAGGTAVIETMFAGTPKEMINMYTADGDRIVLTHYCALGQQPRMTQSATDDKSIKFECAPDAAGSGNIKSRDDGHMDAVALSVDGDKLTEDWTFYADGKAVDHKVFELTRQASK